MFQPRFVMVRKSSANNVQSLWVCGQFTWSREAPILLARKGVERRGRGGAVRAKEGRRQVSALGSSIPDFCPPDDNSRSVNSPYGHIQTIAKYPLR